MKYTEKHSSISSEVGYLAAAFAAPRSFQKSMIDRSATDQGVVTGLTMAISYSIAAVLQDSVETTTRQFTDEPEKYRFASSLASVGAGLLLQNIFQQQDNEPLHRSALRTLGYWLTLTGVSGGVVNTLDAILDNEDTASHYSNAFVLPIGVLIALLFDFAKYKKIIAYKDTHIVTSPAKVIGVSALIIVVLSGLSRSEKYVAHKAQSIIQTYARPLAKTWLPIGHAASLLALFGALGFGITRLYRKIESAQDVIEKNLTLSPANPNVSGSPQSFVTWQTLSKEGRRHIGTINSAQNIQNVMTTKDHCIDPIRIYVGLDSGATPKERIQLALKEIDRTKALERKYVILIAPTGSGYVNYVMSDSVEYLSGGDCAQITMQYSKRPSPLSLDMVDDGYIQYRTLINLIAKKVRLMPEKKRPRLVLFGESLGAWVSQDAFLHGGTDSLLATGIEAAFWIGTPELSKWQTHALAHDRLDFDASLIGNFDNIHEYNALPQKKKETIKYIMCTHYNDPISHFSGSLLIRSPQWLHKNYIRPTTLPQNTHYRTPTTFVQTLIDMKNALKPKPGIFTSKGHDYRADILEFINIVYGFNASSNELALVHEQLVANDKQRANA